MILKKEEVEEGSNDIKVNINANMDTNRKTETDMNTETGTNGACLSQIIQALAPREKEWLVLTLLEKQGSKDVAKDLLLLLVTLLGKGFIMQNFDDGETFLHYLCERNEYTSLCDEEVISKVIEMGGKEIVLKKDVDGHSPLHLAIKCNASIDIKLKLAEIGGEDIAVATDRDGQNPLHSACNKVLLEKKSLLLVNEEELEILTQYNGAKVMTQRDSFGETPLQIFITKALDPYQRMDAEAQERKYKQISDNAAIMIKKGIDLQVGGEYGIGGLFIFPQSIIVRKRLYDNWDPIVLPALEQVMALPHFKNLPILQAIIHAIIYNRAPPKIINSTKDKFSFSTNTMDSYGRYPLDVAIHHSLEWNRGMKELVEGSNVKYLERIDASTGLYPFMLAGLGGKKNGYDFDTLFCLVKKVFP